jgi:uncharacterized repeat protein (TIGR01451 family)
MIRALKTGAAALLAGFGVIAPAAAQSVQCHGNPITLLDFSGSTLVSGTPLAAGAVYRFANVAAGVDAIVRIDAVTNGVLTIIDRDTGNVPAFQPELGGTNERSADFTISFVVAGGATPVSVDFAASGIDIDGDSASLREYSEFSTPFAAFVLENPTNLDVNASGPSTPSHFRFEARTNFTAPGIDPTATANIVSILYQGRTSFQYRIGALGTGATNRLTSLDFSCPVLNFPATNPQADQDFGDAPISYGNPAHDIVAGLRLGATNTIDAGAYNSSSANADAGDDGVTFPSLNQTFQSTISVAAAGTGGRLQGWIDWNGDGDFFDAGEQIAADIADNGAGDANPAAGIVGINVTPSAFTTTAQTFARFRWSTALALGPSVFAPDGEIEDYAVTISAAPPPPSCPAGLTLFNQSGNAAAVTTGTGVANAARALGPLAAAGTSPPDAASAEINNAADTLVLDFGVLVAQNSTIVMSAARDGGAQGNTARVTIETSADGAAYMTAGTYGTAPATFPAATQDILERINLTAPIGGVRFIRLRTVNNDDMFIDGLEYGAICIGTATIVAAKTVAPAVASGAGQFQIPGNDVIYTISAANIGAGSADAGSVLVIDTLPAEIEFFNGDIDGAGPATGPVFFSQSGAGLTFNPASDVGYSNSATRPATVAACIYAPAAGYDPNVRHICINPKGAMLSGDPDPTFSIQFRARIK